MHRKDATVKHGCMLTQQLVKNAMNQITDIVTYIIC